MFSSQGKGIDVIDVRLNLDWKMVDAVGKYEYKEKLTLPNGTIESVKKLLLRRYSTSALGHCHGSSWYNILYIYIILLQFNSWSLPVHSIGIRIYIIRTSHYVFMVPLLNRISFFFPLVCKISLRMKKKCPTVSGDRRWFLWTVEKKIDQSRRSKVRGCRP